MIVHWKTLFISVASYATLSVFALALTMALAKNGHGNFMLPFMAFAWPPMILLMNTKSEHSPIPSIALGSVLMVCVSFVTYPAQYFFPEKLATPYYGPAGAISALLLVIPAVVLLRRLGMFKLRDGPNA